MLHEPDSNSPRDVARHYLGDLIYGANDGLVTTLSVVGGVNGADLTPSVVLILGFVNLIVDGFSMGASNYLAIRSASGADRGVREPLMHGLATFTAFVVAGSIPVLPYALGVAPSNAFAVSCSLTALALFGIGAARSLVVSGRWARLGSEMLGIGTAAAALAYVAGAVLARVVDG